MPKDSKKIFFKIIENLSFKSAIAKKFSKYITALIAIIILLLVVSIKTLEKVSIQRFEQGIKFATSIIAESIEDPLVGNDYIFLEKLIETLTSNQQDIVYIIIFSEDQRVFLSTIDSYQGKHFSELGDVFSSLTVNDTQLMLRREKDDFIRKKLYQDRKAIQQEITDLKKAYLQLRLVGTLQDVEKRKNELEVKIRQLEEGITNLVNEKDLLDENRNSSKITKINKSISSKKQELKLYSEVLNPLTSMGGLITRLATKDKLRERIPSDNMIYEISSPIGISDGISHGLIRIGFSPKAERKRIIDLYLFSLLGGILFVILGIGISLLLGRKITVPLGELAKGAEILGSGNLYHRIHISTGDEMELLADRFNKMAEKLNESYSNLEQKVQERTREYLDATKELQRAYRQLQATQAQLVHNEKMSSLGQLVAGVAHELNNPIGFITSNMQPLEESLRSIMGILELYKGVEYSDEEKEKIEAYIEENDIEYVLDDIKDLIQDIKEGADRAHKIVRDLKNFSRLDEAEYKEVDVIHGIESTLNLLTKHYKHRINVHKEYTDVPFINCYASQLNQVWMNLLVNAAQAIEGDGDVWIRAYVNAHYLVVEIEDSGKGIPEEIQEKIFDPFYTTKAVGEGTGLGLSITHSIIEKHQGIIEFVSIQGKGTKFIVKLPILKISSGTIENQQNTIDKRDPEDNEKI